MAHLATPLQAMQIPLQLYVRLLCGETPKLYALPSEIERQRVHLDGEKWFFPEHPPSSQVCGRKFYWAAAAHAVAHQRYGGDRFETGTLKPIQRLLLALLEDARVEWLAMLALPGLRRVWGAFHVIVEPSTPTLQHLLQRLAHSLFDPDHVDPHPWVRKGQALFFANLKKHDFVMRHEALMLRDIASRLGHDVGQLRLTLEARQYRIEPAYRDDNAHLWDTPDESSVVVTAVAAQTGGSAKIEPKGANSLAAKQDTGMVAGSGLDVSSQRGEQDSPSQVIADAVTGGDKGAVRLREWDHLIRRYRGNWCTAYEVDLSAPTTFVEASRVQAGPVERAVAQRIVASTMARSAPRRDLDGDTLDLDAVIALRVDRLHGLAGDPRVYQCTPLVRQGTLVVLLDVSASAAHPERGEQAATALDRTCAFGLALADVARRGQYHCAVFGFASNGRSHVRLQRIMAFGDLLVPKILHERLLQLRPEWSTRLGAALRFGLLKLQRTPGPRPRHVIMVTDGEAHDVDVHDARYLHADFQAAVHEAALVGIRVSLLDPGGRIRDVGAKNARSVSMHRTQYVK